VPKKISLKPIYFHRLLSLHIVANSHLRTQTIT
jgi:hypothetical protein